MWLRREGKKGERKGEGGREGEERGGRVRERETVNLFIFIFSLYSRFFCDCGAGTLGRNCLLTGYKAYSSPKGSKNSQQSQGQQNQDSSNHQHPNIPVQQDQNTSTS